MTTSGFADLEAKAGAGERLSRTDAERVIASVDLVSIGMLGDAARRQIAGDTMTFGRVCEVGAASVPATRGDASEVRLIGAPQSIKDACARVRAAVDVAAGVVLTGFSAADLFVLCGEDMSALTACAARLKDEGLEAVADVPIDRFRSTADAVAVVRAIVAGGLGAWRLTVERAALDARLDVCERAASIQEATGAIRAFAPLPRLDPVDTPSTGFDDVRTIAVARLVCHGIEAIQVDWPIYGPKLAQVALTYGANDVDGVAAFDTLNLGPRRAPKEDIRRQILAAAGVPVERNGRYERLS